jgi:zinc and cadmium transporter
MPEAAISPVWLLVIYCAIELLASLAGGWLMLMMHLTHRRLQMGISFVAGLMLGVALLDFLPDGAEQLHSVNRTAAWALGGFLTMFFVQRFFHFHHHDVPQGDPEGCGHEHEEASDHDHGHDHGHTHPGHTLAERSARQLSWIGTALGLTLHSLLDGLAMAAAVLAESGSGTKVAGLGVALVVILHKPFDAMAVSTLMAAGGKSKSSRHWLNALFALATPAGAFLFWMGASRVADSNAAYVGCALAFCAGTFLCIASSDLLPELQFHSHDRFALSFALVAGLAVAITISQFESGSPEPAAVPTRLQEAPLTGKPGGG